MTVKFKQSLKSVPQGWVAMSSEQTAKINLEAVFDGFYPEFKNELKAKEPQTMMLYTLVVLTTEAESTPKWAIWDTCITSVSGDFLGQFKVQKEIQQQRLTGKEITGYKFVAYQASDGYSNLKYLDDYCETKFEPKPKVYINGPKKSNEFLTKKAKQYANAKNI